MTEALQYWTNRRGLAVAMVEAAEAEEEEEEEAAVVVEILEEVVLQDWEDCFRLACRS